MPPLRLGKTDVRTNIIGLATAETLLWPRPRMGKNKEEGLPDVFATTSHDKCQYNLLTYRALPWCGSILLF
jgi:hypothetical protein